MRKDDREQMKSALKEVFPWLEHRQEQGENLLDMARDICLDYEEQFAANGFGRGAFLVEAGGHLACLSPTARGWQAIDLGNLRHRINDPMAKWQKSPAIAYALSLPKGQTQDAEKN